MSTDGDAMGVVRGFETVLGSRRDDVPEEIDSDDVVVMTIGRGSAGMFDSERCGVAGGSTGTSVSDESMCLPMFGSSAGGRNHLSRSGEASGAS